MRSSQIALLIAVLGTSILTCVFGIYQNSGDRLGGSISIPKIGWLNFALVMFFVIPAFLGRRDIAYRFVFWSFVVRGGIELYLLTQTDQWRCWMGISHNLFTLVVFIWLGWRRRGGFGPLLAVTLVLESVMAWLFSQLASPKDGIYFASNDAAFENVNTFTMVVLSVVYPWLIGAFWLNLKGGKVVESIG